MKFLSSLLVLGSFAAYASLNYQPSHEAENKIDRPRLEKKDIALPEQRASSAIRGEMFQEEQAKSFEASDQHGDVKKNGPEASDSGQLTPYGIK